MIMLNSRVHMGITSKMCCSSGETIFWDHVNSYLQLLITSMTSLFINHELNTRLSGVEVSGYKGYFFVKRKEALLTNLYQPAGA